MRRPLIVCAGCVVFLRLLAATAQAQPPTNPPPPNPEPPTQLRAYPSLTLIYYGGREGHRHKRSRCFYLDEWAANKDVVITAQWSEAHLNTAPDDAPRVRTFRSPAEGAITERIWKIEYVDAREEGESYVMVGGAGLPRTILPIYAPDDSITLLHIPTSGWYELGQASRAHRHFQRTQPIQPIQPTQPIFPPDTQNPG